jgi:hypothetical protein
VTRAVDAAVRFARDVGYRVDAPRLLHRANNTVVHLAPAPLVAKIDTSNWTGRSGASLATELAVALHLVDARAPAVRPASGVPTRLHVVDGFAMTFWDHVDVDHAAPDAVSAADALRDVHEGLAAYAGALPSFDEFIRGVERALATDSLPGLDDAARAVVGDVAAAARNWLDAQRFALRPLHGDAQLSNALATKGGVVWCDFEAACQGPLEWDLSALPVAADAVIPHDPERLKWFRRIRSICVAVWCAVEPRRAPEVAEAVDVHVRVLSGEELA